jgi:hypothetical protein
VNIAGTGALLVLFRRRMAASGFEDTADLRLVTIASARSPGGWGDLARLDAGSASRSGADRFARRGLALGYAAFFGCAGCWACTSWTRCCAARRGRLTGQARH